MIRQASPWGQFHAILHEQGVYPSGYVRSDEGYTNIVNCRSSSKIAFMFKAQGRSILDCAIDIGLRSEIVSVELRLALLAVAIEDLETLMTRRPEPRKAYTREYIHTDRGPDTAGL